MTVVPAKTQSLHMHDTMDVTFRSLIKSFLRNPVLRAHEH